MDVDRPESESTAVGATETPADSAPQPMGQFDRLMGALFDPKPAFADIAARPHRWWVPLLILIILATTVTFAIGERIGWETIMRQQLSGNERVQQLPAEQQERIIQQQLRFVGTFAYVGAVLSWPIVTAVVAAVMLFFFSVLGGHDIKYKQAYGIVCYSMLPQAVGGVAALATLFLKEPRDFNIEAPVASNLAVFLDPDTVSAWVRMLVSSFDVFTIWVLLLLSIGFGAAGRKLNWSKSFPLVLSAWGIYVLVKVGWQAAFG